MFARCQLLPQYQSQQVRSTERGRLSGVFLMGKPLGDPCTGEINGGPGPACPVLRRAPNPLGSRGSERHRADGISQHNGISQRGLAAGLAGTTVRRASKGNRADCGMCLRHGPYVFDLLLVVIYISC